MPDQPYPTGSEKVKWVSPAWLEEHLDDRMLIIDSQPNIHDYIAEHIPGAVYLNEEFLRAVKRGLCGQFMAVEPDGTVLPCQSYYRPLGNILKDQWQNIWNHELCNRIRKREYLDETCMTAEATST